MLRVRYYVLTSTNTSSYTNKNSITGHHYIHETNPTYCHATAILHCSTCELEKAHTFRNNRSKLEITTCASISKSLCYSCAGSQSSWGDTHTSLCPKQEVCMIQQTANKCCVLQVISKTCQRRLTLYKIKMCCWNNISLHIISLILIVTCQLNWLSLTPLKARLTMPNCAASTNT